MTAKPSQWADAPFPLVETTAWASRDPNEHSSITMALDMSRAHNMFMRGLNAIYVQAPQVHASNLTDVKDFMFFCKAIMVMINHHHAAEEAILFPGISALTGDPALMAINIDQHQTFHDGIEAFEAYIKQTEAQPEKYRWEDLKDCVDVFGPPLVQHLNAEIDTLLALREYDSRALQKIWKRTEDVAKAPTDIQMAKITGPCGLGCLDRSFEDGFHRDFPPLPFFVSLLIKHWLAKEHKGAWRFLPSSFDGYPRPLAFGPGTQKT